MKNRKGKIIYIGKAKKLKNRVSQYFGSQNGHPLKVRKMVENVDDFDYILCDSEFEALVLEASLIKQNMPKYNILLKDSKGYSYIKVTNDPYRKISAVLQKDDSGSRFIGPFIPLNSRLTRLTEFSGSPNAIRSSREILKRADRALTFILIGVWESAQAKFLCQSTTRR